MGEIAKPPICSRQQWGARPAKSPPRHTAVTHIIVHHTESPNDTPDWQEKVRFIQRLHMDTRGWRDIAYSYLIAPDGTIYEGAAGGDNVRTTHCRRLNDHTMGVALLGNFDAVAPSAAAVAGLVKLLAWKCAAAGLDPRAVTEHPTSKRRLHVITGHRDGDPSKSCPGQKLYELLPTIREDVARPSLDSN